MVSQDSPPHQNSSTLHQFIFSNSIASETNFPHHNFESCPTPNFRSTSSSSTYPQSIDVLPTIESLGERMSRSIDIVQAPMGGEESDEMNHTRHLMDLLGAAANETNHHHTQRLSLSLGSNVLLDPNLITPNYLISGEESRVDRFNAHYSFSPSTHLSQSYLTCYGAESFAVAVANSKYLRPVQSLLEEVVSIGGKAVNLSNEKFVRRLSRNSKRGSLGLCSELNLEIHINGFSPEKHQLQVKIAKLISLLEEVERRYEQYYHQLEQVISSFEVMAGLGAGKSYTALALQAMSRHFCSLRDEIVSQINAAKMEFAQDLPKLNSGESQLGLFDPETRTNHRLSLQQLGMIQSQRQAWRPIRGLPETSVTILRSWLFEHFLHPYPNDSEKLMLASHTGLTKNQISNWFINARVRLWKPMIEEMYKEEFADSLDDSNPLLGGREEEDLTNNEG